MKIEQLDMTQAACKDVDPDMFFPEQGTKYRTAEAAKEVCKSCAVKFDCLQVALANGYEGVWGGLTSVERDSLKRRERRQRRGRVHESKVVSSDDGRGKTPVHKANLAAANAVRIAQVSAKSVTLVGQALQVLGNSAPENLRKVGQARVDNPNASLQELADLMGVTKDSYAGAIRRLLKLANR